MKYIIFIFFIFISINTVAQSNVKYYGTSESDRERIIRDRNSDCISCGPDRVLCGPIARDVRAQCSKKARETASFATEAQRKIFGEDMSKSVSYSNYAQKTRGKPTVSTYYLLGESDFKGKLKNNGKALDVDGQRPKSYEEYLRHLTTGEPIGSSPTTEIVLATPPVAEVAAPAKSIAAPPGLGVFKTVSNANEEPSNFVEAPRPVVPVAAPYVAPKEITKIVNTAPPVPPAKPAVEPETPKAAASNATELSTVTVVGSPTKILCEGAPWEKLSLNACQCEAEVIKRREKECAELKDDLKLRDGSVETCVEKITKGSLFDSKVSAYHEALSKKISYNEMPSYFPIKGGCYTETKILIDLYGAEDMRLRLPVQNIRMNDKVVGAYQAELRKMFAARDIKSRTSLSGLCSEIYKIDPSIEKAECSKIIRDPSYKIPDPKTYRTIYTFLAKYTLLEQDIEMKKLRTKNKYQGPVGEKACADGVNAVLQKKFDTKIELPAIPNEASVFPPRLMPGASTNSEKARLQFLDKVQDLRSQGFFKANSELKECVRTQRTGPSDPSTSAR